METFILQEINEAHKRLNNTLNALDESQASWRLSPESWSILDCLEHIYLSEVGITKLMVKTFDPPLPQADKDEYFGKEAIRERLLNRSRKWQAPENIVPKGIFQSVAQAGTKLTQQRELLIQAAESGKLKLDRSLWKHPLFGSMPRSDWFYFLMFHPDRHLAQIAEIIQHKSGH